MKTLPSSKSTSKAHRRRHSRELKIHAISLAQKPDIGFRRAADDLGIHESLLRKWAEEMTLHGQDAFPGHGQRSGVEAEMEHLRRENSILKMERDILKKATVFFAKESR